MSSSPSEPTDSTASLQMWPGLEPSPEMLKFAGESKEKRKRMTEGEGRPVAFDSPPGSPPLPSPPPKPVKAKKRRCSNFPVEGEAPGKKIEFSSPEASPEPPAPEVCIGCEQTQCVCVVGDPNGNGTMLQDHCYCFTDGE